MNSTQSSPSSQTTAIGKHPCPECGGNLEWSAAKQALVCPYCGTIADWKPSDGAGGMGGDAAIIEHDLEQALRDPAVSRHWGGQRKEVKCQNCHAISVFVDGRVAQRCDFCGSPAIVAHEEMQDAITPQSILPFNVSDGQVRDRIRQWYGSRWFAPNRLKTAALTDTIHGVYLPYWTFDAHAHAQWSADAGHYYYTTETYRDSNGQTKSRQVRHVRWTPASGSLSHFFDDTLVPGTKGVHPKLLRQVEPFPTQTSLKPYAPEYVRGWTVERYQVDLRRAAQLGQKQMSEQLHQMCAQQVPGDTHRNLQVDARYQGRTFKHVLVPVWLVHYTYGRTTYQIIANGYTGQLAGERPYSVVKIALAVLLGLVLLALVLYYGQLQ
ncbi:zinc ribbon domain-containing protein [Lampropedia hyalina]|nr:zinc ribbon domain-containing protein [Lampropedia hyalina]